MERRKLRQVREKKQLSQEELAEKIGTTAQNIIRWEKGKSSPQPHFRRKLCDVLGIDADQLNDLLQLEGHDEQPGDGQTDTLSGSIAPLKDCEAARSTRELS